MEDRHEKDLDAQVLAWLREAYKVGQHHDIGRSFAETPANARTPAGGWRPGCYSYGSRSSRGPEAEGTWGKWDRSTSVRREGRWNHGKTRCGARGCNPRTSPRKVADWLARLGSRVPALRRVFLGRSGLCRGRGCSRRGSRRRRLAEFDVPKDRVEFDVFDADFLRDVSSGAAGFHLKGEFQPFDIAIVAKVGLHGKFLAPKLARAFPLEQQKRAAVIKILAHSAFLGGDLEPPNVLILELVF